MRAVEGKREASVREVSIGEKNIEKGGKTYSIPAQIHEHSHSLRLSSRFGHNLLVGLVLGLDLLLLALRAELLPGVLLRRFRLLGLLGSKGFGGVLLGGVDLVWVLTAPLEEKEEGQYRQVCVRERDTETHILAASAREPALLSPLAIPAPFFRNFCPSPIGVTIPCSFTPNPVPLFHPIFCSIFNPNDPDDSS